ncbi:ABC transporter permease [Malacoplasma muris]|uniref:ABC transporter permease n=1 Tax=Malacoplasma muris TaxID=2119 RepID=UPI00398F336D
MWQLIKQVLHSFKRSILLIVSLIFISAVIIFSSFSSLYLGTNIYNSTNHLNITGNKSNAIVEENYATSNIKYNYEKDSQGNIVSTQPAIAYKIDKDKANKDGYQTDNYAVVFPYTSENQTFTYTNSTGESLTYASFTAAGLNGDNPYAYRTPGMLAGYGGNEITGETVDVPNNFNDWVAFAYSLKNNGSIRTNFDYVNINPKTKKINGYFDESFVSYIPVMRGIFHATKATFNTKAEVTADTNTFLSNADRYTGTINTAFLSGFGGAQIPVGDNMNEDVLETTIGRDVIHYLNSLVVQDTDLSKYTQVNLLLDFDSLNDFQRKIFDTYFTDEEKEKYTNFQLVLRNTWVHNPSHNTTSINDTKPSNEALITLVNQRIEDLIPELTKKIEGYYSQALSDMLSEKKIKHDEQKSFVITDQKTTNKYIVAKKGSTSIDDIVYTEGTKLNNSTKYLDVNELFRADYHLVNKKKYLKNYINFLYESINASGAKIPAFVSQALENLKYSFDNSTAVNDSYYNFIFGYFPSDMLYLNPKEQMKFDRQGESIEYKLKHGLTDIYLDSTIVKIDKYSYAAVISDGFLVANKKKILPNKEWQEALKLNSYDFVKWINTLDDSNCIEINARKFVIIGTGLSPEMAFPSIGIDNPIPNVNTEAVVYVNALGYDAILATAPLSYQYKYFSLDLGYGNDGGGIFSAFNPDRSELRKNIKSLNNYFQPLLNKNSSTPIVYSLNDFTTVKNLITMRSYYPNQILYGVILVSIIVIVILVLLGLYLSYLLIKGYITKNQVQLAIIKANGFSSIAITLSITLFGLVCSLIAGAIGYVVAFYMQNLFYQILSPYWYAPMALLSFSPVGFIGGILSLLGVFVVFTFIIIRLTFRKPINELITQNVEMKSSRLLNIIRKPSKINPLFKFRLSLSFSNIWRTIFFTALCSIGLSSISVGLAIPGKFAESNLQTSYNKHYSYKFGLTETTEQSGLYKLQQYSHLGFTDISQGIYPLYQGTMQVAYDYDEKGLPIYNENDAQKTTYNFADQFGYPYTLNDVKVYEVQDNNGSISLKEKRDKFGNLLYYGNILIPSYQAYQKITSQVNFYQNTSMTKWLLDFTIPGLNINPWQLIKRIIPNEIVVRAETQDQVFLKAVYENEQLRKLESIGLSPTKFINYSNNIYSVNADTIIGNLGKPEEIGYSKDFLKFVGAVYGNEELSNLDVKLSYGVVSYDSQSETYSSVNSSLYKNNSLLVDKVDLIGINVNSKYITLVDREKRDLNKLLSEVSNNVYNIVINQGAAYKHKLKVGDIIDVTPNKGYFYYSQQIANDYSQNNIKHNFKKTYKFKVAGISSISYGDEYYISQDVANIINQSAMNFEHPELGGRFKANRPFAFNTANIEQSFIGPNKNQEVRIDGALDGTDPNTKAQYDLAVNNRFTDFYRYDYKPFNGIISSADSPVFLNKTISFESIIGVWNQLNYSSTDELVSQFNDGFFTNPTNSATANVYLDNMVTANTDILKLTGWNENDRAKLREKMKTALTTNILFAQYIRDVFGSYPTSINIENIESYGTIKYLYENLVSTIDLIQTLLTIILIPLIIVMILVISASMLQEFKKMIIVLKTIGYSDKDNIISILATFIPIILLTLLIGIGVVAAILSIFQFVIYTASTVFITGVINWMTYGIGIAVIMAVLIINFVAMIIMYKQQKLKTAIVD